MTIDRRKDAMGTAVMEFIEKGTGRSITVSSTMFDDDEIPVEYLFRTIDGMPELERRAITMARGRVLDVGAGAGCHAMVLQERGFEVTAVDASPLCCEAMRRRGIRDVICTDIFDETFHGTYDTIFLLMNGTGIAGTISRMPLLFSRLRKLLAEGGQILTDSTDLRYIYENEDGTMDINLNSAYYGEVDFRMRYGDVCGDRFPWLYIDYPLLQQAAHDAGMKTEKIIDGPHYDYLARVWR